MGITCLASGMRFDVPVLKWPVVESYLRDQQESLKQRMLLSQETRDREQGGQGALLRSVRYAYRLTRREFDALRTLAPLLDDFFIDCVKESLQLLVTLFRKPVVRREPDSLVENLWRLYTNGCVALMAVGHLPSADGLGLAASCAGDVMIASRGMWWAVNQPERTMASMERMLQAVESGEGVMTVEQLNLSYLPPLVAMATRFPYLRRTALDLLEDLHKQAGWTDQFAGMKKWLRDGESRAQLGLATVHVLPAFFPSQFPQDLKAPSAERLRKAKEMQDPLAQARSFSPWHEKMMKWWDPLKDVAVPVATDPGPPVVKNPDAVEHVELWRTAMNNCLMSPSRDTSGLATLLTLAPMESLIPGPQPDAWLKLGAGVNYLRTLLPHVFKMQQSEAEPVSAPATPGPNAPCPCGSGRKYKKCCGAV